MQHNEDIGTREDLSLYRIETAKKNLHPANLNQCVSRGVSGAWRCANPSFLQYFFHPIAFKSHLPHDSWRLRNVVKSMVLGFLILRKIDDFRCFCKRVMSKIRLDRMAEHDSTIGSRYPKRYQNVGIKAHTKSMIICHIESERRTQSAKECDVSISLYPFSIFMTEYELRPYIIPTSVKYDLTNI